MVRKNSSKGMKSGISKDAGKASAMQSKDVSNKTIAILLFATIIVSLGGSFIVLSPMGKGGFAGTLGKIAGLAITPNATATLTISGTSSIKFSQATVDFGSGQVNTSGGYNNCSLSTLPEYQNYGCIDFNKVSNGFTVENDGNRNLSVELMAIVSAVQFLGSAGAMFVWNVTYNETDSCLNASANGNGRVFPNTSAGVCGNANGATESCGAIFESITTSFKTICPRLSYVDTSDTLNIDLNITIPYDSPEGTKLAGLTVRGTRDPFV